MDRNSGSTRIEGLGDLPFGTHFCLFYETKQDLLETLIDYFKAGIDDHEFCLWITSESIIEEARNTLRQAIPEVDKYLEAGDIEIATYRQWFFTADTFNIPQAIGNWNSRLSKALANGYSRMRAAGDLAWLDTASWHVFSDYERNLDERIANKNLLLVCAYPAKGLSASEVLDIAQTHEYVAAKRHGNWEILETPGLKRTEMESQNYREEPKQQIKGLTKSGPFWPPILPAIFSYSVAILSVIIATIILTQMEINLVAATHVSLYLCVVLLSAWLGGTGPGLLALVFSGLAFDYFFLPPVNSLAIEAAQLPRLVVFVLASFFIVMLSAAQRRAVESLRHMRDSLKRNIQALQAEIVERKQAEKALRESETKLKEAQQLAHIGYWDHDLINDRITGSEGAYRIFGLLPEGGVLSQAKLLEMIHPDDRQIQQKTLSDVLQGSRLYDVEYRIIRPDGDIRFVHVRDEIEYDQSGQPIRMFGAVQDITEWKRAEEAIRKSEQVLREAESLGHTGSWEQNLVTGEIFNTEENLRLFFGDDRSKGTLVEDFIQAVHPDDREFVMQSHAQLVAEGSPRDIEYRVVWPDGSVHVIFGLATVVRDELGNAIRVYGTNLDITERKQVEEAVRESQQLIHLVLATLPVGVSVLDQAGNIVLVNDASKRIWVGMIASGRDRWAQTKGFWHDTGERIDPANWASERALSEGQTSLNELIDIETYDGQQKTIRNSAAPIRDAEGLIVGAVFVNEDVTERVRAEEETKQQAGRAETLARIAARLNRQLDLEAVVLAVCQEIVDTFKVSQAVMNLYDKDSDRLVYAGGINIPPEYAAIMEPIPREQFEEFLRAMGPIMVVPDIQSLPDVPIAEFSFHFDVRTVVTAAMLRDEELIGVVALGVNGRIREFTKDELTLLQAISDQAAQALANARLLKAANEQHEQLRALSTRLVETQETERRAIARDLHDDVGQTLTGLMMQLGMVKSMLPKSAKSMHNTLEKSEALIQEILEHTRSIITNLRPQVLDDLGLVPALQRLGDDFQVNTAVKVEMNLARLPKRLPTQLEVALFRIVQEALTNVRKHARANRVSIVLSKEDELVILSVQDDGLGFEKKITRSRANGDMVIQGGWMIPAGHFGLIGIQERVTQLGGRLQISGASGHGTILRVELPLSEAKAVSNENL